MSGVRCGSRLDQLLDLRRRLDLEIAQERMQSWRDGNGPRPQSLKPSHRFNSADILLREIGATAHDVKVWALEAGLISEVKRGRVGIDLVKAYASALAVAAVGAL